MPILTVKDAGDDVAELKRGWSERKKKFEMWMGLLNLDNVLYKRGLESYVSNDPRTTYNMGHFLMTTGETRHSIPLEGDNQAEFAKQAKVERAIDYMWRIINEDRRKGGNPSFVSELGFQLLALGWYSVLIGYDPATGFMIPRLWSPANTYPRFDDNELSAVVHSYSLSKMAAIRKAAMLGWEYNPPNKAGNVVLDNYFYYDVDGSLLNIVFIDSKAVTPFVIRENIMVLVSPVGGFPERGTVVDGTEWRGMLGQSLLETNRKEDNQFNKLMTMQMQAVRDTINPISQEISQGAPKVSVEQLTKRGAHFHFAPGDLGLSFIAKPPIPLELQALLQEVSKRKQKGGFSDAVYGLVEQGLSGFAFDRIAGSSANQVLEPYIGAMEFVIAQADRFWLKNLKRQGRTFKVKGKMVETLRSTEIPEDVDVVVSSEIATTKDWLERATTASTAERHLDQTTILSEIYKVPDPQDIIKRQRLDLVTNHPVAQNIKAIEAFESHADFLESQGDTRQAKLWRQGAIALQTQLGVPPAGSAPVAEQAEVERAVAEGAPPREPGVPPELGGEPEGGAGVEIPQ